MIKFYMIITLLLIFYFLMWKIEKDLIQEKEFQERKQREKEERFERGFYW